MPESQKTSYTLDTHLYNVRVFGPGELSPDDVLMNLSRLAAAKIMTGIDEPVEVPRELRKVLLPTRTF